ncbi:hypothetical protein FACS1894147_10470 [Spirochaetia bacterium]|nr:hypothetical protein FACS1894147_10470 [Spirochaetia bacterium]
MLLNAFKKDIINQLAAAAEKRILNNPLAPYFRAFTGAFDPRMPFTVYFEMTNKPALFIFDAKPNEERSRRAVFVEHCERICENTLRITNVIQDLTDGGYLSVDSPEANTRPPLPPNWDCWWRKYTHLSLYLIEGLAFVCYSRLTPTEKLYDVRQKFNAHSVFS